MVKSATFVAFLAMSILSVQIRAEFKHPGLFLDSAEIAEIRFRIDEGRQPWKQGFDVLIKDAITVLQQKNLSVTYQGSTGNDYFTEPPYCGWTKAKSPCGSACCDGKINPQADRADYQAAADLSRSVRTLGLAYAFTGESLYADKALTLIRAWFLTPSTRMTPKITNNQSQIELYITIPGVMYGADLIWNHTGWSQNEKDSFRLWVKTFMKDVAGRSHGTNYENWRLVLLSSGAFMAEDSLLLHSAFDTWKKNISSQVNAKGQMIKELDRTKSLDYSTYAMNAMVQTAEIARHQGVDLYNYKLKDGRGLELVLDYHAPFILNPTRWTYPQIDAYKGENGAIYELAYSHRQKAPYKEVIDKLGRPLIEIRTLGLTTLTHAYRPITTSIQGGLPKPSNSSPEEISNPIPHDLNGRQILPGESPAPGIFFSPEDPKPAAKTSP